ncbi:hypothetical protein BpHYR1_032454 [Brachionus plicatilis]|uniref:Uncharacterized protein n=1 Tax=Brachionus plicatilis TaxID=10195 RepID=A0A3M7SU55_BRAPC|nr:hypothetical protein BpHYR1_032454 [Brachionus plicatilis]
MDALHSKCRVRFLTWGRAIVSFNGYAGAELSSRSRADLYTTGFANLLNTGMRTKIDAFEYCLVKCLDTDWLVKMPKRTG